MSTNPPAFVEQLTANAPRTWSEVRSRVSEGSFPDLLKELCAAAIPLISEEIGDDWLGRFQDRNGVPLILGLLAPIYGAYLIRTIELGFQLRLLRTIPGMTRLRSDIVGPPTAESWGHSQLVLSLAALEQRRTGAAEVEIKLGPDTWTPDVALATPDGPVYVECLRMVIGSSIVEQMRTGASTTALLYDEWSRIGARLVDKAGQPSQRRGWLRCETDSGIFHDTDWYSHSLAVGTLESKLEWLATNLRESMVASGDLGGIVFSSIPMHGLPQLADTECTLSDGARALLRNLPGGRRRETFIVPLSASDSETDVWSDLYSSEPSWFEWALGELARLGS